MGITHFLKVWSTSSLKLFGSDFFGIRWLLISLIVLVYWVLSSWVSFRKLCFSSKFWHEFFHIVFYNIWNLFSFYFSLFLNAFLFYVFRKEEHKSPKYTSIVLSILHSRSKILSIHSGFWLTHLQKRLSPIWWFILIVVLQ